MKRYHHHIQPLLYGVVLLIVMGGLLWFSVESERQMRSDFAKQVGGLEKALVQRIDDLETSVEKDVGILSGRVSTLSESFEDSKVVTLQRIGDLSASVESTRQESMQALSDLRGDVQSELQSLESEVGDFSSVIEETLPATVSIATNSGLGSGAFVEESGFIITNYHVVEGTEQIWVQTYDGSIFPAQLMASAPSHDLALLKVATDGPFTIVTFGSVSDVRVGERVVALGSPGGLGFTATQGIVSAKNRIGMNQQANYLQIDVPINPGNSGGPVINGVGNVVGIANFKLPNFEGVGFALQADIIVAFLEEALAQFS